MLKKIYVFECDDRYKIGVSKDVDTRLKQLKCALPNIKSIFESEYMANPYKVESFLHQIFKHCSIGGEWFSEIDMEKIKSAIDMVSETEEKEKIISEGKRKEIDKHFRDLLYGPVEKLKEEIDCSGIKEENAQIEKFIQSINGIDCPNIYSDLIYETVIGKNTEELVSLYNPRRFESFRAKLPKEINGKIDNITMLVGSLIYLGWGYEKIKEFVYENCKYKIEENNHG